MRLTFTLTELLCVSVALLFAGALLGCFLLVRSPDLTATVFERMPGFYLLMGASVLVCLTFCIVAWVPVQTVAALCQTVSGPQADDEEEDSEYGEDEDNDDEEDEDDDDFDDEDEDFDDEEDEPEDNLEHSLRRYRQPVIH